MKVILALAVLLASAATTTPAADRSAGAGITGDATRDDLNLFQMVARSQVIVDVRILSGSLRYALVEIQETLKGSPESDRLRVAFREFNWNRPKGEPPIEFPDGQREILFLVPYTGVKRTEKNRDLYALYRGEAGRVILAAEGSDPVAEAIRRLVRIAALDAAAQVAALKELIGSPNTALRGAGLREVARLRAVDPSLYAVLTTVLSSSETGARVDALGLVRLMFGTFGTGEGMLPEEQQGRIALVRVMEMARNDRAAAVRRAAVVAMAAWPQRDEIDPDLRNLAAQDPDQTVRYEAQRALLDSDR